MQPAAAAAGGDDGMAQRLPVAVVDRDVEQSAVEGAEVRPRGIWDDVSLPESRQVLL